MARKALEPGMVIELQRQGQEGFEAFTMTDKFASSFRSLTRRFPVFFHSSGKWMLSRRSMDSVPFFRTMLSTCGIRQILS